jgi:hypothetical protein
MFARNSHFRIASTIYRNDFQNICCYRLLSKLILIHPSSAKFISFQVMELFHIQFGHKIEGEAMIGIG